MTPTNSTPANPIPPGWPDPLESPQAEAIRNGKLDDTEIRNLFDCMERELRLHRERAANPAQGVTDAMVEVACKAHAPQWEGMDDVIKVYARQQMRDALTAAIGAGGQAVSWTVYDWEYTDPETGRWSCARTPERAERLIAAGVKLTPVYVPSSAIAHPVQPGWRGMESAPKDGTEFIALEDDDVYKCNWLEQDDGEGHVSEGWWDHINQSFENPTGWMPLPAAPQPKGE